MRLALLPDPVDNRNVIIEIRAGTGGDEAGIFAEISTACIHDILILRGGSIL